MLKRIFVTLCMLAALACGTTQEVAVTQLPTGLVQEVVNVVDQVADIDQVLPPVVATALPPEPSPVPVPGPAQPAPAAPPAPQPTGTTAQPTAEQPTQPARPASSTASSHDSYIVYVLPAGTTVATETPAATTLPTETPTALDTPAFVDPNATALPSTPETSIQNIAVLVTIVLLLLATAVILFFVLGAAMGKRNEKLRIVHKLADSMPSGQVKEIVDDSPVDDLTDPK